MTRPDAIPVRPLGSRAVLPPGAVVALFGSGATLRPSATVEVVVRGEAVARVPVETGEPLTLWLDATAGVPESAVSLRGPAGALPAEARAVRSRLVMPERLRRAWGVGDEATLDLGGVAACLPVEDGRETEALVEQALWLGARRPEAARWRPALDLAAPEAPSQDHGALVLDGRVVTETDVRQARLRHRRIRLRPGQIVTPAARSLAREWDVFEEG